MLRIRATGPLILASLLKQPCCQAFALLTSIGSRVTAPDSLDRTYCSRSSAVPPGWSATMPPKRGHWQRKKEERSRSFAKRGRIGGWGDYGADGPRKSEVGSQTGGAAAGSPLAEERTAAGAASGNNAKRPAGRGAKSNENTKSSGNIRKQTRRVETVHPGSYAGELGATLSDERRQVLKDRFEQDDKKAAQAKEEQEKTKAAPTSTEGVSAEAAPTDPVVGPNGEGGVASSSSKKKVALLISYWGSDYQGLQINKGAKTIEAELEMALYLAGAISKDNFGNPRKVAWSRAGRTDKGVHAVAQLISVKLTYTNDGEKEMVEAINSYLPDSIRAVDIKRAPKSFDSRTRCTSRRYEYIMPTYVLAPKEHIAALFEEALEWEQSQGGGGSSTASNVEAAAGDISSVAGGSIEVDLAQPGGFESVTSDAALEGDASVKPAAAALAATVTSEIGGTTATTASATLKAAATAVPAEAAGEGREHATSAQDCNGGSRSDDDGDSNGDDDDDSQQEVDEAKEARLRQAVALSSSAVVRRVAENLKGYRLPSDRAEELRETLKGFVGTKNYHNYTNHKQSEDPSCKRLITSFVAADPFENDGVEWVRLTVKGQSFMMHQIRKMVASSVDRVRGQSTSQDFTKSFFPVKINLGIAPSEGLYLERPLYEPYNAHAKRTGADDRVLEWNSGPEAEALEAFKTNKIQAGILAKETADRDFVAWLDRITRYPCAY